MPRYTFAYAGNQCGQRIHSNLSLPHPQLGCNIAVELDETRSLGRALLVVAKEGSGSSGRVLQSVSFSKTVLRSSSWQARKSHPSSSSRSKA